MGALSAQDVASALRDAPAVRIVGGGTKLAWGRPMEAPELSLAELDAVVEHNEGDFTAILQAGVPLGAAQRLFADAGQMLALDPPDDGATVGGVVATADSGPLRHRYGGPRDVILGVQVAMADGTLARAGSKVIKNVAGYDLAKLMTGAYGTLGVVTEVSVRLHPRPREALTVVVRSDDPRALAATASELAHRPLEAERLDVRWQDGSGAVLVQLCGPSAVDRAASLDGEVVEDDDALWSAQRAAQRGPVVLRVSSTQQGLADVLDAAREHGATCVARAAHGLAWLRFDRADAELVGRLRARLGRCTLLDAPAELRREVDPWGTLAAEPLMRRVKARFDPFDTCNPGLLLT
ncbi:MAG: glycolate oxidase binding subunit [Solirubrobacteraceae bacterium]|jgi:glycolate oxidase FAD binding subunit|nr:glycolate oxidase binding subunit [Solirubrobacteraceae bacterium]